MKGIRELIDFTPIAENIGKSFIIGYGAGAACGAIVGFTRNHDNLPLVTLNDALNCGERYSSDFGYTFGMTAGIHTLTRQLAQKLNPVQQHAIAGGVAGTFVGSHWGVKGAVSGCFIGAAVGAGYGYASSHGQLDFFFK